MPRDDHIFEREPFGYFFHGEGEEVLKEVFVEWPAGTAPGVEEGLALAGFTESPALIAGSSQPLLRAYARERSAAANDGRVSIAHGDRHARLAVVLRHRDWASPPVFFADFPSLSEFESAVTVMLRLLDRR